MLSRCTDSGIYSCSWAVSLLTKHAASHPVLSGITARKPRVFACKVGDYNDSSNLRTAGGPIN